MTPRPSHRYQPFVLSCMDDIPQLGRLSEPRRLAMRALAHVLPFRTNSYVVDELIDWDDIPDDPIFQLTFPQPGMLEPADLAEVSSLVRAGASAQQIRPVADRIRLKLNPHPAGQLEHNVPRLDGTPLPGLQHKYKETVLFFPGRGQTCHAYCTYCFRWAQFVGMEELKFAQRETESFHAYLRRHEEVSDVLFTGGDPMIMRAWHLRAYIEPLLQPRFDHIRHIRIGTKALAFWPRKFVSDPDSDTLLRLFEEVVESGRHLALMAHFTHPRELETPMVRQAIERIRSTGAVIELDSARGELRFEQRLGRAVPQQHVSQPLGDLAGRLGEHEGLLRSHVETHIVRARKQLQHGEETGRENHLYAGVQSTPTRGLEPLGVRRLGVAVRGFHGGSISAAASAHTAPLSRRQRQHGEKEKERDEHDEEGHIARVDHPAGEVLEVIE